MQHTPRLGRRIPISVAEREAIGTMDTILNIAVPDRVVERAAATTTDSSSSAATSVDCSLSKNSNSQYCEKPTSTATLTLPIILGSAIPIIGAFILFVYLQRRHNRKQREEDANDPTATLDFGMGDVPKATNRKGLPPIAVIDNIDYREKDGKRTRQVSMDLAMNSPYLLPPELQGSRESLHSLSRMHEKEDPYRPVSQFVANDGASIRSYSKPGRDGSSIYTSSSGAPSRLQDIAKADLLSNAGPMPRSTPPNGFIPPPRQNSLPPKKEPFSPVDSISSGPPPYPIEPAAVHLPEPVAQAGVQRKSLQALTTGLPTTPRPDGPSPVTSPARLPASTAGTEQSPTPDSPPNKRKSPPPAINTRLSTSRPAPKESIPAAQATSMDDGSDYGDGFKVTPPSPKHENNAEFMRGQRYSMDVPPEEFAQAGLGAPGFDPKRISLGFRPLPPSATTETEDPETRANRIRSFYKEYFDDSKPAPQGQYYEDYDQNYLGDAAYFDPDSNSFVMPYAQPVTRRAMTPPPRGPRFQGPPRSMNGSPSPMGPKGAFPPGPYPPGPYPRGAPKAYSTVSGGKQAPPKRALPPPAALNTLPTPAKLADDSFAIMGAMEFAPPSSVRDRVQGRCDSPVGERRPYSPMVPAANPLASAFDELAPMPSPHMLRRSGTFTALDFAPPKKFKDPDSMSDSGSIRSNRSGISQMQLGAIRNGAYRVSRLPKDMVFSKDDMAASLKPQWGMRPGQS